MGRQEDMRLQRRLPQVKVRLLRRELGLGVGGRGGCGGV